MNEWTVLRDDEWERLLNDVEEGDEVYITVGDDPVAVLVSVERWDELSDARRRERGEDDATDRTSAG